MVCVMALTSGLSVAPASAAPVKRKHLYSCYDDLGTYVHWIDFKRGGRYVATGGVTGRYSHDPANVRIVWRSGLFEGYRTKHIGWVDGSDQIVFFFRDGGETYRWTCYNDLTP